jgi:hypothetical protein
MKSQLFKIIGCILCIGLENPVCKANDRTQNLLENIAPYVENLSTVREYLNHGTPVIINSSIILTILKRLQSKNFLYNNQFSDRNALVSIHYLISEFEKHFRIAFAPSIFRVLPESSLDEVIEHEYHAFREGGFKELEFLPKFLQQMKHNQVGVLFSRIFIPINDSPQAVSRSLGEVSLIFKFVNQLYVINLNNEEIRIYRFADWVNTYRRKVYKRTQPLEQLKIEQDLEYDEHQALISLREKYVQDLENFYTDLKGLEKKGLRQYLKKNHKSIHLAFDVIADNTHKFEDISLPRLISQVEKLKKQVAEMKTNQFKEFLNEHWNKTIHHLPMKFIPVLFGNVSIPSK